MKYTNKKGDGQVLPEACCNLDPSKDIAIFKPADENCIYAPSTSNSKMDVVSEHIISTFFCYKITLKEFSFLLPNIFNMVYARTWKQILAKQLSTLLLCNCAKRMTVHTTSFLFKLLYIKQKKMLLKNQQQKSKQ